MAKFCKNALQGEPIVLNGGGNQTRDFVYVSDVASIISDLIWERIDDDSVSSGGVLNVATGHQTSIASLAEKLKRFFHGKVESIVINDGPPREGDVYSSVVDATLLNVHFPNRKMRSLDETLGRVVDWFVSVKR